MRHNMIRLSVAAAALLSVQQVTALPFSSPDPRSFAMGGAGVAAGTTANASFFNPALLAAAREGEDFAMEFPIASVTAADPDDFITAVDDFAAADYVTALDNAITTFNTSPSTATLASLQTASGNLSTGLQSLSNKEVLTELDAGFTVGIPSRRFGVAVYGNAWTVGGAMATFDTTDLNTLATLDAAAAAILVAGTGTLPSPTLSTTIDARAALVAEVGVSVARRIELADHDFAVGVTPKYMQVTIYDQQFSGSTLDTAALDSTVNETTETGVNADLGIATAFDNGWKVGLVVKNLAAQEYTSALGNKISINTQARGGVAYQNDWLTMTADMDLMENDPVGLESPTQYAAVGAELDVFNTAQARIGYRSNLSNSADDQVTAGLGFSPFGVHMDLAASMGQGNAYGAALQLGFRF